jgi:hypothetical protein
MLLFLSEWCAAFKMGSASSAVSRALLNVSRVYIDGWADAFALRSCYACILVASLVVRQLTEPEHQSAIFTLFLGQSLQSLCRSASFLMPCAGMCAGVLYLMSCLAEFKDLRAELESADAVPMLLDLLATCTDTQIQVLPACLSAGLILPTRDHHSCSLPFSWLDLCQPGTTIPAACLVLALDLFLSLQ